MQKQRKRATSPRMTPPRLPRPEYTAAVRYCDGRRDIFRIRNADDIDDARAMVFAELECEGLAAVVIALRH